MPSPLDQIAESLPPLEDKVWTSLVTAAAQQVSVDVPAAPARKIKEAAVSEPPSSPFLDALRNAVQTYQDKQYGGGKSVTARFQFNTLDPEVKADSSASDGFTLQTYAELCDSHHPSRTGYWAGTWHVLTTADHSRTVQGTIAVHVHNAADGPHVRATRRIPAKTAETATDVMKIIRQADASLLADLTDPDPAVSSLKRVRRILPITKTRMKWDDAAHKGINMLNARNTSHK